MTTIAGIVLSGLLILAAAEAGAQVPDQPAVPVAQLREAYASDANAARAKYAGRPIVVSGAIGRINLDQLSGTDNVLLGGNLLGSALLAIFAKGVSARALTVGQTVVLACVMDKAGGLFAYQCRFQ